MPQRLRHVVVGAGLAGARTVQRLQNLLGRSARYDRLPYFFTDQYDLSMEYTGSATPGSYDGLVVRGDPSSLHVAAFWVSGARVLAAMACNVDGVIPAAERIIGTRREVELDALGDPSVHLAELAGQTYRPTAVHLADTHERTPSR